MKIQKTLFLHRNLLLAFFGIFLISHQAFSQYDCSTAVAASEGIQAVPATDSSNHWYAYTMPSDGKLQITSNSNEYVHIYTGTCDNLDWRAYGHEEVTVTSLSPGDEVLIMWNSYRGGDFDWELTILPFDEGEECNHPVTAVEGANFLPTAVHQEYWYSFTMPSESKLNITSTSNEYVQVYTGDCGFLDRQGAGYSNLSISSLTAGDQVFIKWMPIYGGNFEWQLDLTPFEPGEDCMHAAEATEGSNSLPATTDNEYWYSFTMPSEGKLNITSNAYENIYVYTGTCENLIQKGSGYQNITVSALDQGEEVFINWRTRSGGNFDWALTVVPYEQGESCDLAVAAAEGVNTVNTQFSQEFWYTFTMPSEGKLEITSSVNEYIYVYTGSCNALVSEGSDNRDIIVTSLSAGEEVFINWTTRYNKNFDWNLSIAPLEIGEICENTAPAAEGTNSLPDTDLEYYWYSYTMPSDGKLQITSTASEYVYVYTGTCNSLHSRGSGYGNTTITSLREDDEVLIRWRTRYGGNFDWNLSIIPFESAEICELSVAAEEGTNSLPETSASEYWYSFTMPSEGKLQVSSNSGRRVIVYSGTCDYLYHEEADYGSVTVESLTVGEEVFIRWFTNYGGNFDWELDIVPFDPGENCDTPVSATEGTNSIPETSESAYWYSFTMPSEGKLKLNSTSGEYVDVYTGSCENLYSKGSSYENITINTLSAGEEVFIRWNTRYSHGAFDWDLTIVPFGPGERCDLSVVAEDGSNSLPATTQREYWYSFTMPSDGKLRLLSNSNEHVTIYSGYCDNRSTIDSGYGTMTVKTLSEGDEILIRWYLYGGGNFNWNLSVIPFNPGDICDLAAEAAEGPNQVPVTAETEYWYSFTMPSAGKLLLLSNSSESAYVYSGTCDDLVWEESGYENLTVTSLSEGEEVFIQWTTAYSGGYFDWEINILPFEQGDNCNLAVEASEGTNFLTSTISSEYWYAFTMPSEGKLKISSNSGENLYIYDGSCRRLDLLSYGYENVTESSLSAGDEVYIKWDTEHSKGEFKWDLTVIPFEPGENCNNAITASVGTNSLRSTVHDEYWYTFTMPSDGKLKLTSSTSRYVRIMTGTCEFVSEAGWGFGDANSSALSEGESVFIRWNPSSGESFNWELSVLPLEPGDKCDIALTATEGDNSLSTNSAEVWYSFTMPSDGKLQISSNSLNYIRVYSGWCPKLRSVGNGYENAAITSLSEGDEVYIMWEIWNQNDFDWDLSVLPLEQGDLCELSVEAVEGTNHLPETANSEYWYTFTMPSDSKLQLEHDSYDYVYIYSGNCNNLIWEGAGNGGAVATGIGEGEEVFIRWRVYNGGDFDWDLILLPLEKGDNCELAADAVLGENFVPFTVNEDYWYSFIMPEDGKIQITSKSTNYVTLYRGRCGDTENLARGYGNVADANFKQGDHVLIQWRPYGGGNFNWDLSIDPLESGDNCLLAVEATEGTNFLPETNNYAYWYSFTMPSEGKLEIISEDWKSFEVYSGQCGYPDKTWYGYENLSISTLSPGEQVFIRWTIYARGAFEWDLNVVPLEDGDNCNYSVEANLGTNSIPAMDGYYWYSFTMPGDGKLQITAALHYLVSIYTGTCDALETVAAGRTDLTGVSHKNGDVYEQISFSTLAEGDEIFIRWNVRHGGDFDWELAVVPLEEGDHCSIPASASLGTNTTQVDDEGLTRYWYAYTMPDEGKLVITTKSSNHLSYYVGTCSTLRYKGEGRTHAEVSNLLPGDVVYLEWNVNSDSYFKWDLALEPLETGDGCSTAAVATEGVNTVPYVSTNQYWYKFVMPREGKLEITSEAEKKVVVFVNSCEYKDALDQGFENVTISTLSEGDEVYVLWNSIWGNHEISTFDWNLEISDLEEGDNCSMAAEASYGSNYTPKTDFWFSYEVPTTGNYTISSLGAEGTNSILSVFSDCSNTLLGEDDNSGPGDQAELTLALVAGETIYIHWNSWDVVENYNWIIVKEGEELLTQSITFDDLPDKHFGDDPFELTATASSGLEVTYELVHGPATLTGNILSATGAGPVAIKAYQLGNESYLAAPPVQRLLNVQKAEQEINIEPISDKSINDGPFDIAGTSSSGLLLSFDVNGPATILGSTVTLDGTIGTVTVAAFQAGNENYNPANLEISFDVTTKTSQEIDFEEIADKRFGDAPFDLSASASSGLLVEFEVVSGPVTLSGNTMTITGAGIVRVNAFQAGDATYNYAVNQQKFDVLKADQQIVLEEIPDKVTTDAPFEVIASTSSGLMPAYSVAGPASISGNTITLDGTAGEVIVIVSQPGDDNYNAAISVRDTFNVIEKSNQTITFEAIEDQLFEKGTMALTATSSSGLEVGYSVTEGPATVLGNTLSFTGVGTVTVEASQMGDFYFFAADPVQQSFEIYTVTGIEDEVMVKISMYPNPVENYLTLETGDATISRIELHDLDGRWVCNFHKDDRALDFVGLKAGVYLLKITSAEKVDILRVVKK